MICCIPLNSCVDGKGKHLRLTERSIHFGENGGTKEIICKNVERWGLYKVVHENEIFRQEGTNRYDCSFECDGLAMKVYANAIEVTANPSPDHKEWIIEMVALGTFVHIGVTQN